MRSSLPSESTLRAGLHFSNCGDLSASTYKFDTLISSGLKSGRVNFAMHASGTSTILISPNQMHLLTYAATASSVYDHHRQVQSVDEVYKNSILAHPEHTLLALWEEPRSRFTKLSAAMAVLRMMLEENNPPMAGYPNEE